MKVLLIQPPWIVSQTTGPPLGLAYLGSCLEKSDHKVKIIDSAILNLDKTNIEREIKQFDPEVVGISSVTKCINYAIELTEFVKKNNPNCMTVLGGPHPTLRAKRTLEENPTVDFAIRNEGEYTFTELLKKKNSKFDFSDIDGISYRVNNCILENKNRSLIENLDKLPFPAYHLLPMNKYKVNDTFLNSGLLGKQGEQYGSMLTSRGCPFGCIFCACHKIMGKKWRVRSPENIVKELKILRYKYGKKIIEFLDDTFSINKQRTIKICKLIRDEGIDISLIVSTRVDLFDQDIAYNLKKAGCNLILFGIESGVQSTLNYLKKGFKISDIERAVKFAKNANIDIRGSFIIGVPGETKKMINQTISFAKKLDLKSTGFSILMPYPGTELYGIAKEKKILRTVDWSKFNPTTPNLKIDNISSRELKGFQMKGTISCNLKKSVLINIIKGLIP